MGPIVLLLLLLLHVLVVVVKRHEDHRVVAVLLAEDEHVLRTLTVRPSVLILEPAELDQVDRDDPALARVVTRSGLEIEVVVGPEGPRSPRLEKLEHLALLARESHARVVGPLEGGHDDELVHLAFLAMNVRVQVLEVEPCVAQSPAGEPDAGHPPVAVVQDAGVDAIRTEPADLCPVLHVRLGGELLGHLVDIGVRHAITNLDARRQVVAVREVPLHENCLVLVREDNRAVHRLGLLLLDRLILLFRHDELLFVKSKVVAM